jgi:hypothetical protein
MAGIRGILAGLAISSAIIAVPAVAQSGASASLTHTVSVTVPPRVKVQVANLSVSTPGLVRNAASQMKTDGLALTVKASRAWVLTIGSASDVAASKSHLQWSSDNGSEFSTVTSTHAVVASGVRSFDAADAKLFFRSATSERARTATGDMQHRQVVLTVSAP